MALFELKCPSLEYVYDMTWAEFMIRLHAWNREQLRKQYAHRDALWFTLIAPYQDPKKLPKSIDRFMPIGETKSNVSEAMIIKMKQVTEEFIQRKKAKENGR